MAFDLDGVLLDCKSSWEWVHNHFGVSNEESHKLFKEGKIDDMEFIRRDVTLWEQALGRRVHIDDILPIIATVPIRTGAIEVLDALKERGYVVGIISGGLKPAIDALTSRVKTPLDFTYYNWVETDDKGHLTKRGIIGVNLRDKGRILEREQNKWGMDASRTVSIGDSYVDIPMFRKSGISIAFNPQSEEVCEAATYTVKSSDLRDVLKYIP